MKQQWSEKCINLLTPEILAIKESWNPTGPEPHNWLHSTKGGSLRYYLPLITKSMQNKRTVGPSLATSLEPLAHRRNVARLSLF